jgi:hypothetical protein
LPAGTTQVLAENYPPPPDEFWKQYKKNMMNNAEALQDFLKALALNPEGFLEFAEVP